MRRQFRQSARPPELNNRGGCLRVVFVVVLVCCQLLLNSYFLSEQHADHALIQKLRSKIDTLEAHDDVSDSIVRLKQSDQDLRQEIQSQIHSLSTKMDGKQRRLESDVLNLVAQKREVAQNKRLLREVRDSIADLIAQGESTRKSMFTANSAASGKRQYLRELGQVLENLALTKKDVELEHNYYDENKGTDTFKSTFSQLEQRKLSLERRLLAILSRVTAQPGNAFAHGQAAAQASVRRDAVAVEDEAAHAQGFQLPKHSVSPSASSASEDEEVDAAVLLRAEEEAEDKEKEDIEESLNEPAALLEEVEFFDDKGEFAQGADSMQTSFSDTFEDLSKRRSGALAHDEAYYFKDTLITFVMPTRFTSRSVIVREMRALAHFITASDAWFPFKSFPRWKDDEAYRNAHFVHFEIIAVIRKAPRNVSINREADLMLHEYSSRSDSMVPLVITAHIVDPFSTAIVDDDIEKNYIPQEGAINIAAGAAAGRLLAIWPGGSAPNPSHSAQWLREILQTFQPGSSVGIMGAVMLEQASFQPKWPKKPLEGAMWWDPKMLAKPLDFNTSDLYVHSAGISFAPATPPDAKNVEEGLPFHCMEGYRYPLHSLASPVEAIGVGVYVVPRELFIRVGGLQEDSNEILATTALSLALRRLGKTARVSLQSFFISSREESVMSRSAELSSYKPMTPNARHLMSFWGKWKDDIAALIKSRRKTELNIMWDTYCDCTGWNVEAINYLTGLEAVAHTQAIADEKCFCRGYPEGVREQLERIRTSRISHIDAWVSHKPPDALPYFPFHGHIRYEERPRFLIARSMYESTELPPYWLQFESKLDEIWVPSQFCYDAFVQNGFKESKLRILNEGVDVNLFNPYATEPLRLPELVGREGDFKFLSIFKWEERKGWDVLARAYFEEFDAHDNVSLVIHTYQMGSNPGTQSPETFQRYLWDWAMRSLRPLLQRRGVPLNKSPAVSPAQGLTFLPNVVFSVREVPALFMPGLYRIADAYVSAHRGEGWGMPMMEAMAMALPTVATNFSGNVDFMSPDNSYLLHVQNITGVSGEWSVGAGMDENADEKNRWAQPSVVHLRKLMREIYTFREKATQKGRRARRDICAKFSREKVRDRVVELLNDLDARNPQSRFQLREKRKGEKRREPSR